MTDINLKTLTPDTSLPKDGFLFGADSQASTNPSVYSTQTVATTLLGSTSLTGDTVATSLPVLDLAQTWSGTSSTVFNGIKLNITDTTSSALSGALEIQYGGSTYMRVGKGAVGYATMWFNSGLTPSASNYYLQFSSGSQYVNSTNNHTFVINNSNGVFAIEASRVSMPATMPFGFTASTIAGGAALDTILTRRGAANLRFGQADAATAVPQTLSVQSIVAGTSSTPGADFTLTGSQNTGAGLAGNLIVSTGFSNTVGTATVTITIATPGVITWTAHGLVTGSPVVFTTTGALPTGITAGTTYFAITSSTLGVNTFQIATSAANAAAGTAVATSGTQSGVQTATTSATVQSPLMTTTTFGPSGLTGSQTTPVLNLAQTWNTSGNATGIKLNVTNTASGTSSLLADFQVGGSTVFSVSKNGMASVRTGFYNNPGLQFGPGGAPAGLYWSGGINVVNDGSIQFSTTDQFVYVNAVLSIQSTSADTLISRRAAANLRFGNADAASPVAQTLSVQSVVSGQTNASAATYPFTITGAQGTGSGAGGSIIFQTAAANAGGGATVQNTLTDTLTLDSVGSVRVVRALTVATLPGTPLAGMIARVSDANTPVIGTTVAGGGAAYALVNYNGANWTVIGV